MRIKILVLVSIIKKNNEAWHSCTFMISAGGKTLTSENCTGIALANSTPTVATINIPANTSFAPEGAAPADPINSNPVSPRTITFVNKTKYSTICINTHNEQFNSDKCTGPSDIKVTSDTPVKLSVSEAGLSSGAYAVTAFMENGHWHYSGRDKNGNVYATKFEPTMYPQSPVSNNTTNHSVGVTYIDTSLVDGFNFGVTVYPDSPALCGHSNKQSIPETNIYSKANPMTLVPKTGTHISDLCPVNPNQAVVENSVMLGCYSDCTYAHVTNSANINAYCCAGPYASATACKASVDHNSLPYNSFVDAGTQNVYAWTYDDNSGTFTCDPNASFTFVIS